MGGLEDMAERWRSGWGWGGGPSPGRLLRGLRAEVNYREGKRRKRERGEREERKQCVRPGPAPTLPTPQLADIPSPLGLRFSTCKAMGLDRWVPRSLQPHSVALGPKNPSALGL